MEKTYIAALVAIREGYTYPKRHTVKRIVAYIAARNPTLAYSATLELTRIHSAVDMPIEYDIDSERSLFA